MGRLASRRGRDRPAARLLHQHVLDRLGVGRLRPDAYAAATPSSTGLAARLRERGVPATCVNFGPWSAAWPTRNPVHGSRQRGVRTLSPADALAGLVDVVAAASAAGPARRRRPNRLGPFPAAVPAGGQAGLPRGGGARATHRADGDTVGERLGKTQLVERLVNAPVQQRRRLLTDYLRDAVAEITLVDASEIREDAGFFDLGMDSLMAVEMRRRIEAGVGKEIPVTVVMDHPACPTWRTTFSVTCSVSARPPTPPPPGSVGDDSLGRTDRDRRGVVPLPRRTGPGGFWDLLSGGVDAIREVPEDRFDIDEFYDPDPDSAARRTRASVDSSTGSTDSIRSSSAFSPREAVWIEPQQRLTLETVWEGLERAGYSPASLRGSRTGIFMGVAANELRTSVVGRVDRQDRTALHHRQRLNAISGRVAFALGLEGPAVAVDTACSSALVAVHQAAQALRFGELRHGIGRRGERPAEPGPMIAASRARMLSPSDDARPSTPPPTATCVARAAAYSYSRD